MIENTPLYCKKFFKEVEFSPYIELNFDNNTLSCILNLHKIVMSRIKNLLFFLFVIGWSVGGVHVNAMITPVQRSNEGSPLLMNCSDVRLVKQKIDLYHHPAGIWIVSCSSQLKNLFPKPVQQEVGFASGVDVNKFDDSLFCDTFNNFKVRIDGNEINDIKMLEKCPNYTDRIGNSCTLDDYSGIGYLNTWVMDFEPEESKEVVVSFSFVVKKPGIKYNPDNKEQWYIEATNWIKQEYVKKAENDFEFHLNAGSFWSSFVDTLLIRTYRSDEWFLIEPENRRDYREQDIIEYTFSEPIGFFSPSETNLVDLSEDFLKDKSKTELKILRNAFPAKYGKHFDNKWIQLYFEKQAWYSKTDYFDIWYLNDFDVRNMKLIYQFEQNIE